MKRIAFIALLATVLAGFLVFVPSTQTTHAAANCAKRDGVNVWASRSASTPRSGKTSLSTPLSGGGPSDFGTIDLWSCLAQADSGDPNNDFSYAYVSFRLHDFGVKSCTITLSYPDTDNSVSRNCAQDAENHTIGAHYWGSGTEASNGYASSVATLTLSGYAPSIDITIEVPVELYQ